MTVPCLIVGVSGFAGAELARILSRSPLFEVRAAFSTKLSGRRLGDLTEAIGTTAELTIQAADAILDVAKPGDFALLATPAKASIDLAPGLLDKGARVIDLSGGFRLREPARFEHAYGFAHPRPDLLETAHYAVPEMPEACGDAAPLSEAALVANPGCYATAALFALAPLVRHQLVTGPLFVDGKSGVSGAGRTVAERYMFTEINENVSAYKVSRHQHAPEIEQALERVAGRSESVCFTPHLMPLTRGLMTTCYARAQDAATEESLQAALRTEYAKHPFVRLHPADEVTIASTARTPRIAVGAHLDVARRSIVSIATIDNLLKGAASQAVQNLGRMAGVDLPEEIWG